MLTEGDINVYTNIDKNQDEEYKLSYNVKFNQYYTIDIFVQITKTLFFMITNYQMIL